MTTHRKHWPVAATSRRRRSPLQIEVLEARALPSGNLPTNLLWNTLQRADFNGDGINELIVQGPDGVWHVGPSGSQEWQFGTLTAFKGSRVVVGDFTGSGVSQVAGLGKDGTWTVGIPQNNLFNTSVWGQWGNPSTWTTLLVGDVTGDHKDDIVGFNLDGTIELAVSTGSSFLSYQIGTWGPRSHWDYLTLADVTGSGRKDLVGFNNDGTWWVGIPTGKTMISEAWTQWSAASNWASVQVGDFNGDGRADIFGFNNNGGVWVGLSSTYTVGLPWSGGTATVSTFTTTEWDQWSPASNWQGVYTGDFNDDGRTDIAGLTTTGNWWLARSTGSSFTTGYWGSVGTTDPFNKVVVGNFDGQGPGPAAELLGFTASGGWWLGTVGALPPNSSGVGVALAPFALASQFYADWPDFTAISPTVTPWQDDTFWQNAVAGNFGPDNRTAFFGFTQGGGAWIATPNDVTLFHSAGLNWPTNISYRKVLTGDFNGDGKIDIAAFAATGEWIIGEQVGLYQFRVFSAADWSPGSAWANVFTGDVNGDGRTDLIGFNNDGSWWVAYSQADGTFVNVQLAQWSAASNWRFLGAGDFNGDGKTDVVGFNNDGTWWLGTSTGSSFQTNVLTKWVSAAHWLQIGVADFNGNGISDIYGVSTDGSWWVGGFSRTGYHAGVWLHWLPFAGLQTVRIGDFNADGLQDIVAIDNAGQWWVGLNRHAAFKIVPWYQWAPGTRTDTLLLGDFTGSGATDFWAFNTDGTHTILQGLSTGGGFGTGTMNTDEAAPWTPGAPFAPSVNQVLFNNLSPTLLQKLYFNNALTYQDYALNYMGVLRGWLADTEVQALPDAAIPGYILAKLNALFPNVVNDLSTLYPGLTQEQYRLLMTMNLVQGYYEYTTTSYSGYDLVDLLRLTQGDCSESAELFRALALLQGVPSQHVSWVINYVSPEAGTEVQMLHAMVVADGMVFDPLENIAMQIDLNFLQKAVPPEDRLAYLLNNHLLYGFYNWNLKPEIRQVYVEQNNDPGILPSFYYYLLEGMGQGSSTVGVY